MTAAELSSQDLPKEYELLLLKTNGLQHEVKRLEEQVAWLKKQLFGKKSERYVHDDQQLYISGYKDLMGADADEQADTKKQIIPAHERKKPKTPSANGISYPDNLPVETIVLDLPEEKKIDPVTGKSLVCIGEDVTEKLAKKAASYFIKKIVRKKYAIAGTPDDGIKTPDLPEAFMPRCAVDESVVADVLVKKFCDHLPLYRQAEILRRDQISISKQTLSSYILKAATVLSPLYRLLEKEIKASGNIFIDESPVDLLAPGTGKTQTGYMVTLVGGQSLDPALKIYKFFPNRKHENIHKILSDYKGVFHSDKYGAYEKEAQQPSKIWMPCMAHVRRKYFEAEAGDPKFRETVLALIQELFAIEERGKNLTPEDRVDLRRKEAMPILENLLAQNKERLKRGLLPKSKLTTAIGYFLNLAPYLRNYIEHPFARLDNNPAERALKLVVIGRKNWLFVGHKEGGEASAIIYSLAQTCRALQVNPHQYFEDVLRRIQDHSNQRLPELLPQNWKPR